MEIWSQINLRYNVMQVRKSRTCRHERPSEIATDQVNSSVLRRGSFSPAVLLAGLLIWSGCGPRSDRLEVTGEVNLSGAPLDSGAIRFTSIGGDKVVASGAMIENGEFRIPQEKGLTPGKYHLEINSPDNDAPPIVVRERPGGPGIPTQPERIPPEYNVDSQQTIEVTMDGDNHFVFDIKSQATK